MNIIQDLEARARRLSKRVVFPEGADPRTIRAVATLAERKTVRPIVIGSEAEIRAASEAAGVGLPAGITTIDPGRHDRAEDYARELFGLRKHKGMTFEAAQTAARAPLYLGALMVKRGDADGSVAGAAHATADVLRAAIQTIGVRPGSKLVSSFFLMVLADGRPVTFSDCGVVPYPEAEELASIGLDAADSHRQLTGEEPRVAFLSFSTLGSASHPAVDKVREAAALAKKLRPELAIDGELQFDAAFVPSVGEKKAPGSKVAGRANVFVFPNLDAGNLGYKIAQRVGGAAAFGPVLQGLQRPANDLSRGATADDIVNVAAITAIQAAG